MNRRRPRSLRFTVQEGFLVRTVTSTGGTYTHRCGKKAFEAVAHALNEAPRQGRGTNMMDLAEQEGLPYTQVNVALEFLKERGVVEVRRRRTYPGSTNTYLDAMIEFHALAEERRHV